MKRLFEPCRLGGLALRNRLVMAAMSRMQGDATGLPSAHSAGYYAGYARRGVGLVITEALWCDARSGRAYFDQPGLASDAHQRAWADIARAVHDAGARVFVQLQHGGRLAEPGLNPEHVSASAGVAAGNTWQRGVPNQPARAATAVEIAGIVRGFAEAAARAAHAGFDGVEIHGARGYLIDDFLSASTNRRDDVYGGSLEGRLRLAREIVEAVRAAAPAMVLSVNLSLYKMDDNAYQPPGGEAEVATIARTLSTAGADLLHVTTRRALRAEPWGRTLVRTVADALAGTGTAVIANGGLSTIEACEAALNDEGASAVSLARALLANPDWIERVQRGQEIRRYEPLMERRPLSEWPS